MTRRPLRRGRAPARHGAIRCRYRFCAVLAGHGATFEPRLVYALQGEQQAWHVDASAGAVLGNAAINDDFYGVSPAFATGQRPAYAAKSGLMLTCLGLGGSYRLQPDWRAFAFLRYDNYTGAANSATTLLRQNSGTSAGIGLLWTWQRSDNLPDMLAIRAIKNPANQ
ncbi:MipA/OmpV family protein [Janthinobacterium sp. LB3P118]|uniref:MipA/OmpV family protein n=1 Tax=Janthinobacterium sp. LB3P118 TaxID=3424195 RepID=UPI003F2841D1